jgi:hypothetical protein
VSESGTLNCVGDAKLSKDEVPGTEGSKRLKSIEFYSEKFNFIV